jgi:hypothetical protein
MMMQINAQIKSLAGSFPFWGFGWAYGQLVSSSASSPWLWPNQRQIPFRTTQTARPGPAQATQPSGRGITFHTQTAKAAAATPASTAPQALSPPAAPTSRPPIARPRATPSPTITQSPAQPSAKFEAVAIATAPTRPARPINSRAIRFASKNSITVSIASPFKGQLLR